MVRIAAFIAGFVLTLIVLVIGSVAFLAATSPDQYNVLIIGSDQRGTERARSDVLFVVSIPKDGKRAPYFLSVPRDTKIEHDEFGLQKITHFYALGERPDDGKELGNVDLTEEVVEDLLGIKIDATVEVTFQSFAEIVDDLGGAVLEGSVVSGEDALAVVRDRFTEGRSDFSRQEDQREILRSLLSRVKEPTKVKSVLGYFEDSSQARLHYNKSKLIHFLIGAGVSRKGKVTIGEMEEGTLPGVGGKIYTPDFGKELYYWIPDMAAIETLVEEHF